MQILIDTNVLLRIAEPAHQQHSIASHSVQVLREGKNELCLVPQILYEFWVVLTRPTANNGLGYSVEEAEKELLDLESSLFRLLRDERVIYDNWRQLISRYSVQGKNAHDTRLVAAMLRHGVKRLLTFNASDFRRFDEIEVTTPEQVVAGR